MNSTLPMGFVRRGDGRYFYVETCHDVIHYLIEMYPETVINRKGCTLYFLQLKLIESQGQ